MGVRGADDSEQNRVGLIRLAEHWRPRSQLTMQTQHSSVDPPDSNTHPVDTRQVAAPVRVECEHNVRDRNAHLDDLRYHWEGLDRRRCQGVVCEAGEADAVWRLLERCALAVR